MWRKAIMLYTLLTFLVGCASEGQLPTTQDHEFMIKNSILLLSVHAMREDAGSLERLLYAPGDREQKLAAAQARRIVASARFQRATKDKLSAIEQAPAWERLRIVSDFFTMLMPSWQIAGDRATADLPELRSEGQRIPPLIYVRGIWRVNLLPDGPADNVEALAAAVDRSATLIEETAAAISQGELRTKEQIEAALIDVPEFAPSNYVPDLVLTLPPAQPHK